MIPTRDELRRDMRRLRRTVTAAERKEAARRFAIIAERAFLLRPGTRIAAYHAYGHEADASQLIERAWRRGCEVFLPVITHVRTSRMEFFRFMPDMALRTNAFGIPEPDPARTPRICPRHLDIVFMPLVAFDARGWRLGSGAGYYDRRMHHLKAGRRWRRPKLIGIAYAQQRVERLLPSEWDIPLAAVITEHAFERFESHPTGTTP